MNKQIVAIHECSHALVCHLCDPRRVPVKVCIHDGEVTGETSYCGVRKDVEITAANISGRIATHLAGKVGEELIFGQEQGGSEQDMSIAAREAEEFGVELSDCEAIAFAALVDNRDLLEAMAQDLVSKGVIRDKALDQWVALASLS